MPQLLDLCYDVLNRTLEEIDPEDLSACAQTSWGFYEFIRNNTGLYKAQYLKNFDDPRRTLNDPDPAWISEVQKLTKCQKMLHSANNDVKRNEFHFIASTVDALIISASSDATGNSYNQQFIARYFRHISQNHEAFLCRSLLHGRAGKILVKPAEDEDDRQLSAKLHCLFGIPESSVGRRILRTHPWARSHVYDLRNYTDGTKWGPFRADGSMRPDWEMIESLMIVLSYNSATCCRRYLQKFRPPWSDPLEGVIPAKANIMPDYPTPLLAQPNIPLQLKDPYDVSGIWARIVCFLDYNDLHDFNFSAQALKLPSYQPRDALVCEEAIRHIVMDVSVTAVKPAGPFGNSALPVVYFSGKARSVDASWDPNANSKLRGSVRLTPSGDVRWETISVFHGEERWRSEGIQIGGLRSERGVIGTWFDKDLDPRGPAGPTAFWKIRDREADSEEEESEDEFQTSWHI